MRPKAVIVLAALSATFVTGGWLVGRGAHGQTEPSAGAGQRLFADVYAHVAAKYVDSVPAERLYDYAASGLVRELGDPNSGLLTPERLRRLSERTSGNYAGVGVRADVRDGLVYVVGVIPGTPAERAGVRPGDRVVEIAGEPTRGLTLEEVTRRMRGAPETPVRFAIERPGVEGRVPFTITRESVHVRSVRRVALLDDGVGYLDLSSFATSSADEVRAGVDSLRALGARAVVFDLRGNPGGLLDEGVAVADLFLDAGRPSSAPPAAPRRRSAATSTRGRSATPDCRWSCSSTAAARARRRSSPARCRTTTAPSSSARPRSARGARSRSSRSPTARRSS
jgi:carboxyl-terminal processing protease